MLLCSYYVHTTTTITTTTERKILDDHVKLCDHAFIPSIGVCEYIFFYLLQMYRYCFVIIFFPLHFYYSVGVYFFPLQSAGAGPLGKLA